MSRPLRITVGPDHRAYILDVPHTPAYAAGYMLAQAKPRVGVVTHESFDHFTLAELVDEIRYHWDGPIGLGMPDLVVFNITKDAIWQREGVIPVSGGIPPLQAHAGGSREAALSEVCPRRGAVPVGDRSGARSQALLPAGHGPPDPQRAAAGVARAAESRMTRSPLRDRA